MNVRGLATYFAILAAPRRSFSRLASAPTWGWAALCGIVMTLLALLVAERAQLHLLALNEAHRLATLPPGERLHERIANAQVAPYRRSLFIIGALTAPWIVWSLIAFFFVLTAALGQGRISLGAAWVAALNSYVVYALGGLVNAMLVAIRDPAMISTSLDLVRLPSPAWLFPHDQHLAAFLSAYSVAGLWYYAVVAIALEELMRVPRAAAVAAALIYSLLFGFFAAFNGRAGP